MSNKEPAKMKPRFRGLAIWRKRGCQCRQRVLLCFGLPLLPPSVALLGVAYGTNQEFGVFHIFGFVLTFISVTCISLAIFMTLYKKYNVSKDPKKVGSVIKLNTQRPRTSSNSSLVSNNGVKLVKMIKIQSVVTESESKPRPRKKKKEQRKHQRKSKAKLPPVKEEDGRARFEKSMEERDRQGKKLHKRTKSESRKGMEQFVLKVNQAPVAPVPRSLTKKHLKMLAIFNNQGSQESLQRRSRSLSMSDIGDSASEGMSIDFPESPRFSKRFVMVKPKIAS